VGGLVNVSAKRTGNDNKKPKVEKLIEFDPLSTNFTKSEVNMSTTAFCGG
jgi:hypothetical protein